MHNLRSNRLQKRIHLIDVATLPRPQAYVMQSDPPLLKTLRAIRVVASRDSYRSPSADAVQHIRAPNHRLHSEIREQLFVKRQARLEIADREHHMRNAVYFHDANSYCALPIRDGRGCSWPSIGCGRYGFSSAAISS